MVNVNMGCGKSASVKSSPSFIWGDSGSVLIKSIKLILLYDQVHKSIKTQVANDKITESLLTWQGRLFTLQDLYIYDISQNKKIKCPEIKAKFSVNEHDQFNQMHETEDFLERISEIYQKKTDSHKSSILLSKIERDCRDLWNFSREFWIKHKIQVKKQEFSHCGRDCISLEVEKKTSQEKIQKFLIEKYKATNFANLKKNIKARIIMQADNQRPHIIKFRKSTALNFNVQVQHLLELEEQVKVFVFCWDDLPDLSDEKFIMNELNKMQKGVTVVYNDLSKEIEML